MSDISALHLAIHSMTGLVTFHADLLMYGVGEWHELPERDDRGRSTSIVASSHRPSPPVVCLRSSSWECWRPGRAEGHLLGGLLHRLVRIQATPWAFAPERFDGAILFFEDLNTSTINVWNDLQVLRHGGVLDRIAGLLVGPIETIQVHGEAPESLRDVVLDVIGDRDIPVLGNLNLGHAGPNIPLPLGVRAAMDGDARTLELDRGRRQLVLSKSSICKTGSSDRANRHGAEHPASTVQGLPAGTRRTHDGPEQPV